MTDRRLAHLLPDTDADERFERWLERVDVYIAAICGLTHHDLADMSWRDWYESDMEPREAAEEALQEEGFPFDEGEE